MVELIEYVIVFAISAGVAGASVMLVNGAMPGLNQVASASKADQVAGAARRAVVEGKSVTLLLPLKGASIACADGSLSVSADGTVRAYDVAFPCSFDLKGLSGDCTLAFTAPANSLQLEAKC